MSLPRNYAEVEMPMVGLHYPGSYGELRAWFPDDAACLDYLDWLRWPAGFVCPHCSNLGGWRMKGSVWRCSDCRRRVSATAGTIFQDTRTPLTVWFAAAWYLTSQKDGASALGLQRVLGLGSYQTAWAMLHRFRTSMVRPGREPLAGEVEVDEIYVGGEEAGLGGRAKVKKELVAVAVERCGSGSGRARMARIPDASRSSLHGFIKVNVESGATLLTDAWSGYLGIEEYGYTHRRVSIRASAESASELLPHVHRVASLLKRWLLGTHQGAVGAGHLEAYLNEFCFRFNRRNSRARGLLFYRLLQLAARTPSITYRELVINPAPKRISPRPPPGPRTNPPSLARPSAGRPWRMATDLG